MGRMMGCLNQLTTAQELFNYGRLHYVGLEGRGSFAGETSIRHVREMASTIFLMTVISQYLHDKTAFRVGFRRRCLPKEEHFREEQYFI
jgi:hypothetical protein